MQIQASAGSAAARSGDREAEHEAVSDIIEDLEAHGIGETLRIMDASTLVSHCINSPSYSMDSKFFMSSFAHALLGRTDIHT